MDNAKYHNCKAENLPNSSTRKDELKSFLALNNISFSGNETRWNVRKDNNVQAKSPLSIWWSSKNINDKVLWNPPYHCEFTPLELVWKDLKNYLVSNNIEFSPAHFNKLIAQFSKEHLETTKMHHLQHVLHLERQYNEFVNFEEQSQPLIIALNDSDSDSDPEWTPATVSYTGSRGWGGNVLHRSAGPADFFGCNVLHSKN